MIDSGWQPSRADLHALYAELDRLSEKNAYPHIRSIVDAEGYRQAEDRDAVCEELRETRLLATGALRERDALLTKVEQLEERLSFTVHKLAATECERDAAQAALSESRAALDELVSKIVGAHTHSSPRLLREESWAAAQFAASLDMTILAQPAPERGAALLAAADRLADVLQDLLQHFKSHTNSDFEHRCEIDRDVSVALDGYRALRPGPTGQRDGDHG